MDFREEEAGEESPGTGMKKPFHMLLKPIGSVCNMHCSYCFYSEKANLYPGEQNWKISDEMLQMFICAYIEAQPGQDVNFLWQGGEPMLMGIDFYRKAMEIQRAHAGGKQIHNSIQTNGTLLTDQWCEFFREENFLVGISLDGPEQVHDKYRAFRNGGGTFAQVMEGVRLLQKHRVDFNVTASVTDESAKDPLAVYEFFKSIGAGYIQFAPIVERLPEKTTEGLWHEHPDRNHSPRPNMAPGSVSPEAYGQSLCTIFDRWIREDIGDVFVMNFEWALERWMGMPASCCIWGDRCGNALAVEHNGDVYICDHFVYPEYHLGNLETTSIDDLLSRGEKTGFASKKADLTEQCLRCTYRPICQGECPKKRFLPTPDGKGLNYLCPGYLAYFRHIHPYMDRLCQLLRAGRPAHEIRNEIKKIGNQP